MDKILSSWLDSYKCKGHWIKLIYLYEILWGSCFIQGFLFFFLTCLVKMVNRKFFTNDIYFSSLLLIVSHKYFQVSRYCGVPKLTLILLWNVFLWLLFLVSHSNQVVMININIINTVYIYLYLSLPSIDISSSKILSEFLLYTNPRQII